MDTLRRGLRTLEVHDDYQRALDALVETKAGGAHPDEAAERTTTANNVVDLMSALIAGVQAATKGPSRRRTNDAEDHHQRAPESWLRHQPQVAGSRTSPVSLPLVPSLV
ncbi:hypothetical protein ACFRCG_02925 [Embleya sp. NPDC056575]|uniref:hypothetical protein n=1 Tax=unclassified Embleya TaxID=2699296 RepID=UPI0036992F81